MIDVSITQTRVVHRKIQTKWTFPKKVRKAVDEKAMNQLIDQAEQEGKWLHCHYQDIWVSPKELQEQQAKGQFRWGVDNWEIRDPEERLQYLERETERAKKECDVFRGRILDWKYS